MPNNIALMGYRGTGKSTVGVAVAGMLGFPYVDTDDLVELRAGCPIATIFASRGEAAFRRAEEEVVAEVTQGRGQVVSLGGGAILRQANRDKIAHSSLVVWLTAEVSTIAKRIGCDPSSQDRRPGLTELGPIAEIEQVLAERTPLYEQLADVKIATDARTTEEIARIICDHWNRVAEA